ncbi:hypothetical protein F3N43_09200 [Alkalilimnicola sp. S0819]|nr:hypothetical protein F3N43_09200 [Alkalilimnicola sp. S0819]MPQ16811.1 hypothetical protein [Alkalilimnicola sp. S0819]
MKHLFAALALALPVSALAADLAATLYKSPTCGCCTAYVDYLREQGFEVEVVDRNNMTPIKLEHGLTREQASCHTTLIDGYVVEGHVPVESIHKLLAERPPVIGITVPGMPIGSPGMGPSRGEPLHVYYISDSAEPRLQATH